MIHYQGDGIFFIKDKKRLSRASLISDVSDSKFRHTLARAKSFRPMGPFEAALQVFPGKVGPSFIKSDSIPFYNELKVKSPRRRVSASTHKQVTSCSSSTLLQSLFGARSSPRKSRILSCKCQKSDGIGSLAREDLKGSWHGQENGVLTPNGANGTVESGKIISVNPVEEEAWKLLRDSMVYYCGSPVGTIAANDPTSSDVLNYDQVFLRDFIPSGIAFLMNEEYDIVRNFILHTLQLQVIISCYYKLQFGLLCCT